jgi:excisionase family DNA binding protein
MTRSATTNRADQLLTVEAAAERMSTSVRFVRRLIAERRIAFVKLGRHVRLTEADVAAFIESGRITPLDASHTWHNDRKVS